MAHDIDSLLKAELEKVRVEITRLQERSASIVALLGPVVPDPIVTAEEWEIRLVDWFKANPQGRHTLGEIREALRAPADGPGAKAFKVALHRAIGAKRLASTGLRGRGAAYWAGPKIQKAG